MRCRNCSKEIDEFEIFCDECKKELKKNSSRTEVKEFEKLVDERSQIDDLENTKELSTLKNLAVETFKNEKNIIESEDIDSDFADIKTNKKTTIIIAVCVIIFLLILALILFILFNKDEEIEEEKVVSIDYEEVLNEYGNQVTTITKNYINEKNEVPTWQQVSELITYNKYEIICEVHNIYMDGNIYLNSCEVDNKPIKYSYGVEQEDIKEGKKIEIYKYINENNLNTYTTINEQGSSLVGTITCKTQNCSFESAYDKYVLINEENKYYLYNYENDTLEFGPFEFENSEYSMFNYENKLYGILYNENGTNNIYNVNTSKTLKNVKGSLYVNENLVFQIMYKYGYVIMENNDKLNFINLKTGNISYSIEEYIGSFIEDTKNGIVYMIAYDSGEDYSKFKLYNSNGKLLFDGKYFKIFKLYNGNLIVANDTNFYVYDSKLKLKYSSIILENILAIYDEYVVSINNNHLEILDINGNVLTTFDEEWNTNYTFHSELSSYNETDGIKKIIISIEDSTLGTSFEYYYIPETKESGKNE